MSTAKNIRFDHENYDQSSKDDIWINERTGERIQARTILKEVKRENFEILYLSYMCDLFDKLGGKKYQVLKYLLANKDYNNIVLTSTRELSCKCKVSKQTVTDTLKILKELNIITTRTGAIMLNAKLINHGNIHKENYLIQRFEVFDK